MLTVTDRGFWCVVPAAGAGHRMGGGIPKQHLRIGSRTLLAWTLERLASHPRIAGLMVVLAQGDAHWDGVAQWLGKPVRVATGGGTRAESVLAGLRALSGEVAQQEFVLVHDAARPLVRHADIGRLMDLAVESGGALLAAPVRDTLKRADSRGCVETTESRESRWRAMTPQMFRRGELESALESAIAAGTSVTDEAMAMELIGLAPLLVEGSDDNLKVTTAADLALAEFLLGACATE